MGIFGNSELDGFLEVDNCFWGGKKWVSMERSRPRPLMFVYIYRRLIMGAAERLLSGQPVVTALVHSHVVSPSVHGTLYLMAIEIHSNQCSTVSNLEAHGLQLRTFSPTPSQRASSRYLFNATAHKLNASRIQLFFYLYHIQNHVHADWMALEVCHDV